MTDKAEESGGAGAENVDTLLQQMQHNHEILRSERPTMLLSYWWRALKKVW